MAQQKTAPPSQRKLKKLRGKGIVPNSKNFNAAISSFVFVLAFTFAGKELLDAIVSISKTVFQSLGNPNTAKLKADFQILTEDLGLLITVPFIATLIAGFLQTGPVFSLEKIKPDFMRLNPLQKFSGPRINQTAWKFFSGVATSITLAAITFIFIKDEISDYFLLSYYPIFQFSELFFQSLPKLILLFSCACLVFAIVDLFLQKKFFLKEHKMTNEEVKQEQKEEYGESQSKNYRDRIRKETSQHD